MGYTWIPPTVPRWIAAGEGGNLSISVPLLLTGRLSGVIQTFNLIDNARLHFRDGTRIHGIITDGGQAVNIIPQTAQAMFSVRALKADYLPVVSERVVKCAEAAALATGTRLETKVQRGYKEMRDNLIMAYRFGEHLRTLGVDFLERDPTAGSGSTDMGDVSYEVPSIHPYMAICDIGESMCHQDTFVEWANRPRGYQTMLSAAKAEWAQHRREVGSCQVLDEGTHRGILGVPLSASPPQRRKGQGSP
jgi:metal-dependent amidase/aminoacylase/carboxypeptidase family protein